MTGDSAPSDSSSLEVRRQEESTDKEEVSVKEQEASDKAPSSGSSNAHKSNKKIGFDFLSDEDNVYIKEFLKLDFVHEMRQNPRFRSFLNHKGLKKEVTEAYAVYMQVQQAIKHLEKTSNRRFISSRPHIYIPQPQPQPASTSAATAAVDYDSVDEPVNNNDDNDNDDKNHLSSDTNDDNVITEDQLVFFDVCSGKGYTSIMLSQFYPKAMFYLLDNDTTMNVAHLEGLDNVKLIRCDILRLVSPKKMAWVNHRPQLFEEIVAEKLKSDPVTGKEKIGIMLGVHLCGPLSPKFIEVYNKTPQVKSMILSPCCLDRRQKQFLAKARESGREKEEVATYAYQLWCEALFRWTGVLQQFSIFSAEALATMDANLVVAGNNNTTTASTTTTTPTLSSSSSANDNNSNDNHNSNNITKFMFVDTLCLSPKNNFIISYKSL